MVILEPAKRVVGGLFFSDNGHIRASKAWRKGLFPMTSCIWFVIAFNDVMYAIMSPMKSYIYMLCVCLPYQLKRFTLRQWLRNFKRDGLGWKWVRFDVPVHYIVSGGGLQRHHTSYVRRIGGHVSSPTVWLPAWSNLGVPQFSCIQMRWRAAN